MSYYDTFDEDLARANEILQKGRWPVDHPTYREVQTIIKSGTIFGDDILAAYKLLESFVAEIERLRHARNTCEIHADIEGIAERTACAVCFTEALDRESRLREDQKMLATTIRNTVLALGDVGDDWEGSVEEGITLINANVERVNAEIADYASSFELYHKASMALMIAYKQAHPEEGLIKVWSDTTKVNVWAAAEIERLRTELTAVREEKRTQTVMLHYIRKRADALLGINRAEGDARKPGAIGAFETLVAEFERLRLRSR
jgi:hypothetical protein